MEFTINQYELISPSDQNLVGISGGKDSLCLWQRLKDKYNSNNKNPPFILPIFIQVLRRLSQEQVII